MIVPTQPSRPYTTNSYNNLVVSLHVASDDERTSNILSSSISLITPPPISAAVQLECVLKL